MTHAAVTTTPPIVSPSVPIAVLGTDALLAALPATPVQLAHACLRAGFASVIPASWGDELIAAAALRKLPQFGSGPVIQCSCPIVAHRLLSVGGDLRPVMLSLVPPPVAVSRYVRTLSQPTRTRITYIGNCPGAVDESIDIRMSPDSLIAMLAERQILLEEQPRVFESIIPPDRRRFRSQAGGIPTAESLWSELGSRTLVEIDGEDVVAEIAQLLLTGKNVLIDTAPRLGCVCSGAIPAVAPRDARARVALQEPPRSTTAVVDERAPIELDAPLQATSRNPIDIAAIPHSSRPMQLMSAGASSDSPFGQRSTPNRGTPAASELRPARVSGPLSSRVVTGAVAAARDTERRSLPRTYVARRRSPVRSIEVLSTLPEPPVVQPPLALPLAPASTTSIPVAPRAPASPLDSAPAATPVAQTNGLPANVPVERAFAFPHMPTSTSAAPWTHPPRRVIVGFVLGVAVIVLLSVVVGAYAARLLVAAAPSSSISVP
jgi:hypothetical protein